MGYVYRSRVNISQASADQPTIIRGSVFGSGENGHVWEDTHVNISGGTIGAERNTTTDTDQHRFLGNVYGSGRGIASTNPDYQQAAFIKNSDVRILGSAHIYNNVYGGGNAGHVRKDTHVTIGTADGDAQPHIDGCSLTSIRQVYGGGNAASTPATQIDINGTYEIEEVFGGGNGKDDISLDGGTTTRPNPGANVGYTNYSVYAIGDGGTLVVRDSVDALTPEARAQNFQYGSGQARVNIHGGRIHRVYGGSNTKGNVRHAALTMLEETKKTDGEQEVPAEP